jgi:hypothetical protein
VTRLEAMAEMCDWCGREMRDIGPAKTGLGRGVARVFWCAPPGCSHQVEQYPAKAVPIRPVPCIALAKAGDYVRHYSAGVTYGRGLERRWWQP